MASPPSIPALTIEQYASLCVDLEVDPIHEHQVLQRYRLTAEQKSALDAHFRRVFAEQPFARSAFADARHQYSAWLRTRRQA